MSLISRFARTSANALSTTELEAIVAQRKAAERAEMFESVLTTLDDSQKAVRQNVSYAFAWIADSIAPSK